jgi:hypothetical protein
MSIVLLENESSCIFIFTAASWAIKILMVTGTFNATAKVHEKLGFSKRVQ